MPNIIDSFNRQIDYLRVSVTDHCNYRCFYCRPEDGSDVSGSGEFLNFEEITRLIRLFTELGISKVRLTGGEPLVRRNLVNLVSKLVQLPGLNDISLSTNGHLLKLFAMPLKMAGVNRVNISLDSIDPDNFRHITRNGNLNKVTRGIEAAIMAGMSPIKINMVVMKGINDHEIETMMDYTIKHGLELRFIETMPVGEAGLQVMNYHYPASQILQRVRNHYGSRLIPVTTDKSSGPARYYQLANSPVKVCVISAISRHFCKTCNRVRLTARGELVLCLGHHNRVSLREGLRDGHSDGELKQDILMAIAKKPEKHDFSRQDKLFVILNNMSNLGG
jgi:cyclic pyranopterin phosphate synthase